jgi:hypothetical protein
MFILKGFKCFLLELFILKQLWAIFSEVRILEWLAEISLRTARGVGRMDPPPGGVRNL